jgi:hypothetical protein
MLGGYRKELELRDELVEAGGAPKDSMWFFESVYYAFKTALRDRTSEVKSVDQLRWRGPQGNPIREPTVDLLAYLKGDDVVSLGGRADADVGVAHLAAIACPAQHAQPTALVVGSACAT